MSRPQTPSSLTSWLGRRLALAVLAIVAFVATPSSGHSAIGQVDALPHPDERLAQPVWLPHCAMSIVEWRSTPALPQETAPTAQALAVIDDTCRDAFARFGDFLRAKHFPQPRERAKVLPTISVLPGNVLLDGKAARALNDLPTRFEAVAPACCYWGLYVDSVNHLFVRNDPLIKQRGALVPNPHFIRTLTHEIAHILSSGLGVWEALGYDRQRDEDLAEAFVAFMGMGFPVESSAEDLAFHREAVPLALAGARPVPAARPEVSASLPPSPRGSSRVPSNANHQR
jgi:hypothetical protein